MINEPVFEGQEQFPGQIKHSHSYKDPSAYKDERVIFLGAKSSGEDISRDCSPVIKEGYLVARKPGACNPN